MKTLYLISGIILFIVIIALALYNTDESIPFNLLSISSVNLNTCILIAIITLLAAGATSLIGLYAMENNKEKHSKHIRIAEKASIQAEESSDRVKTLEAKVQTLEIALQKAFKDTK